MVMFGPIIGAVAERFERRKAQIFFGAFMLATAVVVAGARLYRRAGGLAPRASPAFATASPGPPTTRCGG